jgi:Pirin C-terminal cupin domain
VRRFDNLARMADATDVAAQVAQSKPKAAGKAGAVLASQSVVGVLRVVHARLMFLGGTAMDGPQYIWWNFVCSRKKRIEQAKEEWEGGRFRPVPGETECGNGRCSRIAEVRRFDRALVGRCSRLDIIV